MTQTWIADDGVAYEVERDDSWPGAMLIEDGVTVIRPETKKTAAEARAVAGERTTARLKLDRPPAMAWKVGR